MTCPSSCCISVLALGMEPIALRSQTNTLAIASSLLSVLRTRIHSSGYFRLSCPKGCCPKSTPHGPVILVQGLFLPRAHIAHSFQHSPGIQLKFFSVLCFFGNTSVGCRSNICDMPFLSPHGDRTLGGHVSISNQAQSPGGVRYGVKIWVKVTSIVIASNCRFSRVLCKANLIFCS